jgi:PAS domain S-box-containing protein
MNMTDEDELNHILQEWRKIILNRFLIIAISLSLFAILANFFLDFNNEINAGNYFPFLLVWLVLVTLTFLRRMDLRVRVIGILLGGYSLAIYCLLETGFVIDGILYLFLMPILTIIFLGKLQSLWASFISLSLIVFFTVLGKTGFIISADKMINPNILPVTIMVISLSMSLLYVLNKFLENTIKNELCAKAALEDARKSLAEQNIGLEEKMRVHIAELQQSNKILTAMYKITDAASSSPDMHTFFSQIHIIISELMYAKNFFIALYDETSGLISFPYFVDEVDENPSPRPLEGFHGMSGYIIRTGRTIHHDSDLIKSLIASREVEQIGAINTAGIGVPLKANDKILGAILISSYVEETQYTQQDDEMLAFVAQHIATTLTRFRALESERRRTTELSIINSVQAGITSGLDITLLIDLIGDRIREVFQTANLMVTTYDETKNQVAYRYVYENNERLIFEPQTPHPDGIISRLIKTGQSGCLVYGGCREGDVPILPGTKKCKSGVAAPIFSEKRFLGAIQIENFDQENAFDDEYLGFIKTLSISLGVAIENAQLVNQKNEAMEALRSSEEKYRMIAENSEDLIWTTDTNLNYTFLSQAQNRLTGNTSEEFLHDSIMRNLPERSAKKLMDEYGRRLPEIEKGLDVTALLEYEVFKKDGSLCMVESSIKAMRDARGTLTGFIGITRDISARKQAEEEIKQANQKLNSAMRITRLAFWEMDPALNKLLLNDQFFLLHHTSPEREGGYTLPFETYTRQFIHPEDLPFVVDRISKLLNPENADTTDMYDQRIVCRDGGIRVHSVQVNMMRDEQGIVRKVFGVNQDVTETRQAEVELVEAKKAAEHANKSKSDFLASMSHEIRTPMNAILGFVQLMQRSPELSPQMRDYLSIIDTSGEHLLSLINDILEMSKIEAGRGTYNPGTFDLHRLLNDLEGMLQIKAKAKHLLLMAERSGNVPRWIISDESKLRQVLINLIGNAVKFTHEGGITLRVEARSVPGVGMGLLFEVEDTGIGIADNEMERVFLAFEQSEGGRASGGTGLGLALSQSYVKILGGELSVTSAIGKGSLFKFSIPIQESSTSQVEEIHVKRRVIGLEPGQGKICVLVADDRETNRLLLSQMLSSTGFTVREVVNGSEAVAVFRKWKPRIIFMDMAMPIMDGYEATRIIKTEPGGKDTVIIAVTASAFQDDRQRVFAAGADGFLSKPFKEIDLFETIRRLAGVVYRYTDEEAEASSPALEDDLQDLSEAIASLPPNLIRQCLDATENADMTLLLELIQNIATYSPLAARKLQELSNQYEYEEITSLLNQGVE